MSKTILGNTRRVQGGDLIPPTVPTGLYQSGRTLSNITMSWNASTEAGGSTPITYQLTRDNTIIYTGTGLTYGFTTTENKEYDFAVRAIDSLGNTSAYSAVYVGYTSWAGVSYSSSGGPASYLYYRVNSNSTQMVNIMQFILFSSTGGGGTRYPDPYSTSATTPTGYAWGAGYYYSYIYEPWKLGDGLYYTSWFTLGITAASDAWAAVQLPSAVVARSMRFGCNPGFCDDDNATIQGSNDGLSWTTIGTVSHMSTGDHSDYSFKTINL